MAGTGQMVTAAQIDGLLRAVFEAHVGAEIQVSVHDTGARKVSQIIGEIIGVLGTGFLVQHLHRAGRTMISYRDIFIHHVEVVAPDELGDAVREALGELGVNGPTPHPSKGVPRMRVGPTASGVSRVKRLVG